MDESNNFYILVYARFKRYLSRYFLFPPYGETSSYDRDDKRHGGVRKSMRGWETHRGNFRPS